MSDRSQTIREIVDKHGRLTSGLDGLADSANLYTAGLTSHASVNVMLALEDEFDIEFPERLLKRATFESIANLREAIGSILDGEA